MTETSPHKKMRLKVPKKVKEQIKNIKSKTIPQKSSTGSTYIDTLTPLSDTTSSTQYSGSNLQYSEIKGSNDNKASSYIGYSSSLQPTPSSYYYYETPHSSYTPHHHSHGVVESQNNSLNASTTGDTYSMRSSINNSSNTQTTGTTYTDYTPSSYTYSNTKKIRVRVRRDKSDLHDEAIRILLNRSGKVERAGLTSGYPDMQALEPVSTGDIHDLNLDIRDAVPYISTIKDKNVIDPNMIIYHEPLSMTEIDPPKIPPRSRFQEHHACSTSSGEESDLIDSVSVNPTTISTLDSIKPCPVPSETPFDVFDLDKSALAVAQYQEKLRKEQEKQRLKEEYKLKLAESIRNGTTPPQTITSVTDPDMSTSERDLKMEREVEEWEKRLKEKGLTNEERLALYPESRRHLVDQTRVKMIFSDSSDDDDVSETTYVHPPQILKHNKEFENNEIHQVFDKLKMYKMKCPIVIADNNSTDICEDEMAVLKSAEQARKKEEERRRHALISAQAKRTGRPFDELLKEDEERRRRNRARYIATRTIDSNLKENYMKSSKYMDEPRTTEETFTVTETLSDDNIFVKDFKPQDESELLDESSSSAPNERTVNEQASASEPSQASPPSAPKGRTVNEQTFASELVSATPGSAQYVETSGAGVPYVEVGLTSVGVSGSGNQSSKAPGGVADHESIIEVVEEIYEEDYEEDDKEVKQNNN